MDPSHCSLHCSQQLGSGLAHSHSGKAGEVKTVQAGVCALTELGGACKTHPRHNRNYK